MTEKEIIKWIDTNLGAAIDDAIAGTDFTRSLLVGMAYRETGFLIARYLRKGYTPSTIHAAMKGDYGKRATDVIEQYHGYGYWQIDIASFPAFIASGDWRDPAKTALFAVKVLEGKRKFLRERFAMDDQRLLQASIAAYNCGEGNVKKAIEKDRDLDYYTHQKNYSREVLRFKAIAEQL